MLYFEVAFSWGEGLRSARLPSTTACLSCRPQTFLLRGIGEVLEPSIDSRVWYWESVWGGVWAGPALTFPNLKRKLKMGLFYARLSSPKIRKYFGSKVVAL